MKKQVIKEQVCELPIKRLTRIPEGLSFDR